MYANNARLEKIYLEELENTVRTKFEENGKKTRAKEGKVMTTYPTYRI